jgi:hypothetical protein
MLFYLTEFEHLKNEPAEFERVCGGSYRKESVLRNDCRSFYSNDALMLTVFIESWALILRMHLKCALFSKFVRFALKPSAAAASHARI